MDGIKQQKTIPTVYNMSSSKAISALWPLEELADAGINSQISFPLGKSPTVTLEHVGGEAEVKYQIMPNVLTETRLILQFFSDHYTNGEFAHGSLITKVDHILTFEVIPTMLFFPMRYLTLLMVLPIRMHFMKDLTVIFQIMEDALSEEKPWFSGKNIGLADFNTIFAMDMAVQRGYNQLEKYPKLAKWYNTVQDRPAYKRAKEVGEVYDCATFA
ncbi:hypothetical protein VF21_05736 [Pseudogymnoascus sp. 05NY08]|nr:hypothetical protein VF21_05736 [Pseudogymnoascus sp. 05NY08]